MSAESPSACRSAAGDGLATTPPERDARPPIPQRRPARFLPWAPAVTLAVMLGPVAAGLAGTLAPAFGWLPPLGGEAFSLAPWHDLLATPGLGTSVRLSLVTGLAATALSLALTLLICAAFQGSRLFRLIERAL
ncbi:MAG: hypothetical protein AAFV49_02280, partial [Pseudomonadota bacterium]